MNLIPIPLRRPRRARRHAAGALVLGASALVLAQAGSSALAAAAAAPAAAASSAHTPVDLVLLGHGYGHGMGMGQYGALGYAVEGNTYQQIISHYYGTLADGGTTTLGGLSSQDDGVPLRVAITENAGYDVYVTSDSAFEVDGSYPVPAGGGAWFHLTAGTTPGGSWTVYTDTGPNGCAGGTSGWTMKNSGVAYPTAVPDAEGGLGDPDIGTEALQLCQGTGQVEVLRGQIQGTVNSDGAPRTLDIVPLEQYVADVTPSESPSSWGTVGSAGPQGQPWGFQSTESQAVAARSYAMAQYFSGGYYGYADICDSSACQAYDGIANESPTSSLATTDTTGQVVLLPGGAVASTEYSASTGGYSEAGTFAATVDAGDGVCVSGGPCDGIVNPYHSYTATISSGALEADFPSIGTYESLDITSRNPGGRVEELTVVGSTGSVSTTGDGFASDVAGQVADTLSDGTQTSGIISNFFTVEGDPSGGTGGYWLATTAGGVYPFGDAGAYGSMAGQALNAPVVGVSATSDHRGYWLDATDGGVFAFGDARFEGSMGGSHLNAPVVGMAADPRGGYWLVASDGGIFAFGGAPFLGSMGGSHLNAPVVGMAATADGSGYWLVASDGGIFAFGDARFEGSMGGTPLNQPVVGMAAGHGGYWLVASDGGIFAFGVPFEGSLPGSGISATASFVVPTGDGGGYLVLTLDGQVVPYGDAPDFGELAGTGGWSGFAISGAATP